MALVVVAAAVTEAIVVVAVETTAGVVVLAICSFRPMLGTEAVLAGLVVVTEGFSDASVLTTMTLNYTSISLYVQQKSDILWRFSPSSDVALPLSGLNSLDDDFSSVCVGDDDDSPSAYSSMAGMKPSDTLLLS